jgi:predicted TIM-barrel fold metal-dependent hydrolase
MATQPARTTLAQVFERALGVFGPGRILFGTDSSTFPRGWRADLFAAQKEALQEIGLPEADRERIFGGNARALLASETAKGAFTRL